MVKQKTARLNHVFAALADPTRRAIVERLARGGHTAGELAAPFAMSKPAITKHLIVLEHAGLIVRTRDGRMIRCTLAPEPLSDAVSWMEHTRSFWNDQFNSLEKFLESSSR